MKKARSIIATILLMCIFAACQATPEKEIVASKDSDRLIEIAQSGEADKKISQMVGATQSYSFETISENGNVHIEAKAEVIMPQVDKIPIVRVGRRMLIELDMENVFSVLCERNTVVSDDTLWKSYYKEDLDLLVSMRQQENLDKYDSIEELDAAISALMSDIQKAPEKPKAIEADFTFHSDNDMVTYARILSARNEITLSDINAMNSDTSVTADYIRNVKDRGLYHAHAMATSPYYVASLYTNSARIVIPPAIEENEALRIANETVNAMGFSDLTCSGKRLASIGDAREDNSFIGVYEFLFTRTFNGVACTYTNDLYATPPNDPNSMAKPWGYEYVRVFIDDSGIAFLMINDPYQVETVINEGSALLPFADITKIFEHMVQTKYFGINSNEKVDICVQEVRLGLCRILEKGNGNYGLLIPAWDFMGTLTESNQSGSFTYGRDGYHCLLTINAIDGSIIDKSMGY